MKYANFANSGYVNINIGDYLQFMAVEFLLKQADIPTDEIVHIGLNELTDYDGDEVVFPICYSLPASCLKNGRIAISDKIRPVFLALQFITVDKFVDADKFLSDNYNSDYLRKNGPIGCRDNITYDYMSKYDIPAYINGCMTATFPKSELPRGNKVLYVDAPLSLLPYIPESLRSDCEFSTQQYHFSEDEIQNYKKIFGFVAEKYERYKATAKMVITSRLHVALPMTAFGIPVVLAKENVDARFSFIEKYIPIYSKEDFAHIDWDAKAPEYEDLKGLIINNAVHRILNYEDCALNDTERYLTEQFKARNTTLSAYDDPHSAIHHNNKKFDEYAALCWNKNEPIKYAFWGVSENNFDFWSEYIGSEYPNAKLTNIFDSFREGSFKGLPIERPAAISSYNDLNVIVCSVGAAQSAKKLFKEMNVEKERYCITSDVFIEESDL